MRRRFTSTARWLAGLLAGLAFCAHAPRVRAQEVAGRIFAPSGEPAAWTLVRLVRVDGTEAATTVSRAGGGFLLRAPAPGTYRVRAERIGFEPTISDPLRLRKGERASITLQAVDHPIELEAIQVEATDRVCDIRYEQASQLMTVWGEIRKALELESFTGQSGRFVFHGSLHNYRVDEDGEPPDPEIVEANTFPIVIRNDNGFHAVDPEKLAEEGFRGSDGRLRAPDAGTLLSDPFQRTHCYWLTRSGGLLGVAFGPPPGPVTRVEVRGTLWLDAMSGELRSLDYEYVPSFGSAVVTRGGGHLDFERLPEGAWIVRRWWIRHASYGRDRTRGATGLFYETGGEITDVQHTGQEGADEKPTP